MEFRFLGPQGPDVRILSMCLIAIIGLVIGAFQTYDQGPVVATIASTLWMMVGGGVGYLLFWNDSQSQAGPRPRHSVGVSTESTGKARAKTRRVEVISAIVVILTIIGVVVGIMFPGGITGAILPVATTLWFILYRWMVVIDQKDN